VRRYSNNHIGITSSRTATSTPVTPTLPLYTIVHPDARSSEMRMDVSLGIASPGASLDGGIDICDNNNCNGVCVSLFTSIEDYKSKVLINQVFRRIRHLTFGVLPTFGVAPLGDTTATLLASLACLLDEALVKLRSRPISPPVGALDEIAS
jgi:hypothetical protein